MIECDILGGQNTPTYFQGVNTPTPGSTSFQHVGEPAPNPWWSLSNRPTVKHMLKDSVLCMNIVSWQTLSLRFNGHFPGEPGLAGVYWSKGWWRWWWQLDYWRYIKTCKTPVKSSPSINQHPVFYRPDALPVTQPKVSKHWREKYYIPWTCVPQANLGVFKLCFWPLIAPDYLGEGCHASHQPSDASTLPVDRLPVSILACRKSVHSRVRKTLGTVAEVGRNGLQT